MSRTRVTELFGLPTSVADVDWKSIVKRQRCPYLNRKCLKIRKSQPEIAIGTCSVSHGIRNPKSILICPHRMLGNGMIFMDCLHLLRLHEPGNELHKIPQIEIPGGSGDYFLASVINDQVVDFVGIEIQTLDTTGTVWPDRQRFLQAAGLSNLDNFDGSKTFGMNWKMTAKTILVQLHHKIETFESLAKHLVLVHQDALLEYMMRQFKFDHIGSAKLGHSLHFHAYNFRFGEGDAPKLQLSSRHSTDADGMSTALGLQAKANVELSSIVAKLENKIAADTLLSI
ncbi:MAG: hypothetical protein F4W97_13350 [Chloroflexi bacterium]|nr:hypothetical protein [Chloroflexota bacterium]